MLAFEIMQKLFKENGVDIPKVHLKRAYICSASAEYKIHSHDPSNMILGRFEGTVMAQFYGHTHNDEFAVFYDTEDSSRPVNVGIVTPSITTYTGQCLEIFYTIRPIPNGTKFHETCSVIG